MSVTVPVYGAKVEWSADGTTFAAIPKAKNIVIPEINRDYRDVTSLDSPNGFREWAPGLKDGGELTLECYYSAALYADAAAKEASGVPVHFRVTLPFQAGQTLTSDVFSFQGYVSPAVPQADVEGDLMLNINVRTTGDVTWTQGA